MRLKQSLLALALYMATASALQAGLPSTLNYQGRLRQNIAGFPVVLDNTGNTVTFKIWDSLSAGTQLWAETWSGTTNGVTTANGLFNVVLGSITPINLPFDQPYYLEILWTNPSSVVETMAPRQPLTMAPYAFRAKTVDGPVSVTSSAGTAIYANGGSTGIGLLGTGQTGTAGSAGAPGGIGVLAGDGGQGGGALALKVSGNSLFGAGNVTFTPGSTVYFNGVNTPGLSATVNAPLTLTGAVAMTGAVLTVTNTGGGYGIISAATAPGAGGPSFDSTQTLSAGVYGYSGSSLSAGVLGMNTQALAAVEAGVAGVGYYTGIYGTSYGLSNTAVGGSFDGGAMGTGVNAHGVIGISTQGTTGPGLAAVSTSGIGVTANGGPYGLAVTGSQVGISASAGSGDAVYGVSTGSPAAGVHGRNLSGVGIGVIAEGGLVGLSATAIPGGSAVSAYNNGGVAVDSYGALQMRTTSAPAISLAGTGRIYYDNGSNHLMASENGGSYTQILSGGVSAPLSLTLNAVPAAPLSVSNASGIAVLAAGGGIGISATANAAAGSAIYGRANSTSNAIQGINDGSGPGIYGNSVGGVGVFGTAFTTGVSGTATASASNAAGIYGFGGAASNWGHGVFGAAGAGFANGNSGVLGIYDNAQVFVGYFTNGAGVAGYDDDANGFGVYGRATSTAGGKAVVAEGGAFGVSATASALSGIAISAQGPVALSATGSAQFNGGVANAVTFNTAVIFNGPTSGNISIAAPLSLTLSSAVAAPLTVFNPSGPGILINSGTTTGGTAAVSANSNGATGSVYGVYATANSPAGFAAYGTNQATTGNPISIYGFTPFGSGVGVQGWAGGIGNPATLGGPVGVYGNSPGLAGVYGKSTVTAGVIADGTTVGISVLASGAAANGVVSTVNSTGNAVQATNNGGGGGVYSQVSGSASSVQGNNAGGGNGVYGFSTWGYGVLGSSGGVNPGVVGVSTSGNGVIGSVNSTAIAVQGNNSGGGFGVQGTSGSGIAGSFQGSTGGVSATASSAIGNAVFARSHAVGGSNATVYGLNDGGASSIGVSGIAPSGTGVLGSIGSGIAFQPAGVYGSSNSNAIPGVYGYNNNGGVAVLGNGTGIAGQFSGATFGVSATASTIGTGVGILGEANNTNALGGAVEGLNFAPAAGNGVYGNGLTGVAGVGQDTGVLGSAGAYGVYGTADGGGGVGVYGTTGDPQGFGVMAGAGAGTALFISGTVQTWREVFSIATLGTTNWSVTLLTQAAAGSVKYTNLTSFSPTQITVTCPVCTANSVVMVTFFGFGTVPSVGMLTQAANGSFIVKFSAAVTWTTNAGFNYAVIN